MRRTVLLFLWLLSDLILFWGTYVLAYFLRVGWIFSTDFPFENFIQIVFLISTFWLLTLIFTRTFIVTRTQLSFRNILFLVYASVIALALFALSYFFLFGLFFSRLLLVYAFVISTVAIVLWHIVFEMIMRRALRKDPPFFPTLIVGITRESRALIRTLNTNRNPLTPVAILDVSAKAGEIIEGVEVCGRLHTLEEVLEEKHITHLIQCSALEQSLNLLSACRKRGIQYVLLPSVLGIVERDETVETIERYPVTVVNPEKKWYKYFF